MKYSHIDASRVWHCWNQMDVYLKQMYTLIEKSEGNLVTDQDGKTYLDANSSLWNVNIGHGHPKVIEAINKQLKQLDHSSLFLTTNGPAIELAKKLSELTGNRYPHVFYTNSGSESTDTAMKMTRQYFYNKGKSTKNKFISLQNAYHGSTFGAISVCGIEYDKKPFGDLIPGCIQTKSPDLFQKPVHMTVEEWILSCIDDLETVILNEGADSIAAFISEPIQASEGIGVIPDLYWQGVRKLCDQHEILWISDEIATGFGRTGKMFAAEHSGIWPDMMLLAKGITSGYFPLGAVLVKSEIFECFLGEVDSGKEFVHGFTTSGHPVACATAIANIQVIEEENLVQNAAEIGEFLLSKFYELKNQEGIIDIQGRGLMLGIRLSDQLSAAPIINQWPISMIVTNLLAKRGILVHAASTNAVVLAPALTFTKKNCDDFMKELKYVLGLLNKIKTMKVLNS
ncbi:aspartate aminotransferase family protein [Lysinibacillus boronitolerans]|uniref:aminotransferase family protein n=1 Tax=Lysinibacillus boronitolerans TaxID=309788 RepID=UPI00216203A2|nr:aspartate aminotransferase family protein [Lysinibacillus boronitolerans]MCS1391362.1 aspartate aminotransferase family protein [Lysinibacillus boronitolerans]